MPDEIMRKNGGFIKSEELQNSIVPTDLDFYKKLLDHIGNGVYFVDREQKILYWNEGAHSLTGYKAEEILGKHCQDDLLCPVDHMGNSLCQRGCPLMASIFDGEVHEADVFLRHKQGRRVPVTVQVRPLRGSDGSVIGAVEIFSDNSAEIGARRKIEAMNRLAFLDHLTQLPNRRFLEMSLQTALSESEVHKDPVGLLVVDLDRFKEINDSFGHAWGDRALQEAANTLIGSLRPTDIVGRWGGDEFLAIARNVNREILIELAERCVVLISETSVLRDDEKRFPLSISVGAALSRPGESAEDLFRRADGLLYQSKTGGRGRATTE
jgi:diguanylate cyclase (GGDEF)-like protein/PAS domain S-box-containing protein